MNAKTKGSPFKWLGAMVMSLLMVVVTATPAWGGSLTVNASADSGTHTYSAYKIFDGTYSSDADNLSDVKSWGKSVDTTKEVDGKALIAALQAFIVETDEEATTPFAEVTNAPTFAKALADSGIQSNSDELTSLAALLYKYVDTSKADASFNSGEAATLDDGYYLVVETAQGTSTGAGEKPNEATAFLLQVVGSTTATAKTGVPSVIKKVQQTEGAGADNWRNTADWNIGDSAPFRFEAPVVVDLTTYTKYEYTFHDQMDAGLSFNDDVAVQLVHADGTTTDVTFTVKTGEDATADDTFTVVVDLKTAGAVKGDTVLVTYSATLTSDAVKATKAYDEGNDNEVYLEYTNKQNGDGTGTTPTDKVTVFTYEVDITKVDGSNQSALENVGFTLKNTDTGKYASIDNKGELSWVTVAEGENAPKIWTNSEGKIAVSGLDAGVYVLSETDWLDGYNSIDDVTITVTATHSDDELKLTQLLVSLEQANSVSGTSNEATNNGTALTIVNNMGATLPSTGGMGTTLLYAVGGALVVVAAGILIYKKVRPQEA